ncbi:MAG: hypothetical protein J1E37_05055 [Prevotella sp.]|nr:hypothetical protein [Prevotella sp.]
MARKRFYSVVVSLLLFTSCTTLHTGDLLFHVADKGNSITDVTPGMIDHVAIVFCRDSVIEAVGRGVTITPLDSLRSQQGYYIIGRVKGVDARCSVNNARQYLGRAYDYLYLADNDEIYCSELVQLSFVDKQRNRLFAPVPMSFHDASGQITPYWTQFYAQRGMQVPEGQPGTNPGELSCRHNVRLKGRLK